MKTLAAVGAGKELRIAAQRTGSRPVIAVVTSKPSEASVSGFSTGPWLHALVYVCTSR